MRHILKSIAASVVLTATVAPAWSTYCAPVVTGSSLLTCFGIESTPNGMVDSAKDPARAKAEFLAGKMNVGTLDFSQYDPANVGFAFPDSAAAKFIGAGGGQINQAVFSDSSAGPYVIPDPVAAGLGRFNTSPTGDPQGMILEAGVGFTLTFDSAISAFGFYGMDIGDFGGTLSLRLLLADGTAASPDPIPVPVLPSAPGLEGDPAGGNLVFFGFFNTNPTIQYKAVQFIHTGPEDGFGYDDMVVASLSGEPPNPTPEPAGLALVGAALTAAALVRRRRGRGPH